MPPNLDDIVVLLCSSWLVPLQVFGSQKMWQQFARSYRALNFALLRMNSAFLQTKPPKSAFRTLLLKHVANKTLPLPGKPSRIRRTR